MRTLLIGALGQLGSDFRKILPASETVAVGRADVDVRDARAVDAIVQSAHPEIVVNCTAFNRVDDAEDDVEPAFAINTFGVRNLALACRRADVPLVHFSTDYVFDSPVQRPLTEADLPCPRSVYGISKLAGEHMVQAIQQKHYIVRTCGLFGYTASRDKGNFVETMLRLGGTGKLLKVVNDQRCTPTSTVDLAEATVRLMGSGRYGLYHLTNAGDCSWYEFAREIFELGGLHPEVEPVTSDQFPAKAKRPGYSVLDNRAFRDAGFADMRSWREALAQYIKGRS